MSARDEILLLYPDLGASLDQYELEITTEVRAQLDAKADTLIERGDGLVNISKLLASCCSCEDCHAKNAILATEMEEGSSLHLMIDAWDELR